MVGIGKQRIEEEGNAAHSTMTRPFGYMSEEVFERILNEIVNFGIHSAYLHFQGEPFLNKNTPEYAQRMKNAGLEVSIFTNGQAFDDNSITKIANAEIDLIRFSVDGASEESYQKNRIGGEFAKVADNMQKVVDAHKGRNTRIEWQYLPLRNNEHEIEKAREFAKKIGIGFFTKGFRETDPELAPRNPDYLSKFLKKPCTDIYKQLGIYWNGDVVPCCYDVDAAEVMGNVMNTSLYEIWNSQKYCEFRRNVDKVRKNPEQEPELCKNCLRWR